MGSKNTKQSRKRSKLEESQFLISKLNTKLQYSRQYGTDIRKDIQINKTELSPEINPYIYGQLVFDTAAKTIQCGKERSFQQMVLRQLDIHVQK